MARFDNRKNDELREIRITPGFIKTADGSALIEWGNTRVICTCMLEEGTPLFVEEGRGWLTAEYAMLPASTPRRKKRETLTPDGRSTEIKRLIGRSLRQAVDMAKMAGFTAWIDCDVIEADGGTRVASITGAYVALHLAVQQALASGRLSRDPMLSQVAAVSAGIVGGEPVLDLPYAEDSGAEVDMNIVMNSKGEFIEIQGTGEGRSFSRSEMDLMLELAGSGIERIMHMQLEAVRSGCR